MMARNIPSAKVRKTDMAAKTTVHRKTEHKGGPQRRVAKEAGIVGQPNCNGKARPELLPALRREGAFYIVVDLARLLIDHGIQLGVVDVFLLELGGLAKTGLADLKRTVWVARQR